MSRQQPIPSGKSTIMVVSRDPGLRDIRATVLREAGYEVVSLTSPFELRKACERDEIALIVMGYSVAPNEKRRVWKQAKEFCRVPVLELYRDGNCALVETSRLYTHESHTPTDFVEAVNTILRSRKASPHAKAN
jgi:DNA-binding NtrC family response regulator